MKFYTLSDYLLYMNTMCHLRANENVCLHHAYPFYLPMDSCFLLFISTPSHILYTLLFLSDTCTIHEFTKTFHNDHRGLWTNSFLNNTSNERLKTLINVHIQQHIHNRTYCQLDSYLRIFLEDHLEHHRREDTYCDDFREQFHGESIYTNCSFKSHKHCP